MTLYQYNQLNDNARAEIIWEKGIILHNRLNHKEGANLYRLFDFYVEVFLKLVKYVIPLANELDVSGEEIERPVLKFGEGVELTL